MRIPLSLNILKRWGLPLAAVVCLILLLANFKPAASVPVENGMGGPSEPPLETVLESLAASAAARDALLGSLILHNPGQVLPVEELGPVFRPDEGPVAMRIARGQTFYEALAARGIPIRHGIKRNSAPRSARLPM